jgi:CRP/FNR family transcriptional regulator
MDKEQLAKAYPLFTDEALLTEICEIAVIKEIKSGEVLSQKGSSIRVVPLILSGSIKVLREDEKGNEIFLYHILKGETCAMMLTCCIANKKSDVTAIAEEDSVIIMLPIDVMDRWMVKYQSWKVFVMRIYQDRFEELLNVIDSISFKRLDERLLDYLYNKVEVTGTRELILTHQEIAYELNSSREVISRLLKQMEKKDLLSIERGRILLPKHY